MREPIQRMFKDVRQMKKNLYWMTSILFLLIISGLIILIIRLVK